MPLPLLYYSTRAHIHYQYGHREAINAYLAADGFRQTGWEIVPYTDEQLPHVNAPDERN